MNNSQLQEKLDDIGVSLGVGPSLFNVDGDGTNQGTVIISVGSWPYDYQVSREKLADMLADPKVMILAALRACVP